MGCFQGFFLALPSNSPHLPLHRYLVRGSAPAIPRVQRSCPPRLFPPESPHLVGRPFQIVQVQLPVTVSTPDSQDTLSILPSRTLQMRDTPTGTSSLTLPPGSSRQPLISDCARQQSHTSLCDPQTAQDTGPPLHRVHLKPPDLGDPPSHSTDGPDPAPLLG